MCLQNHERSIRHIRQWSMRLFTGTHPCGTCCRNVPRNNLATEYSIIGVYYSSTTVGHILALDNMINELELGVVFAHDRHSSRHGRQICSRESECCTFNVSDINLAINRCTIDIGVRTPLYIVANNNARNLCFVDNRDAGTCRSYCVINNLGQGHCIWVRHARPDDLGIRNLSIRLLVGKLQASLYNRWILAQDNAVIAGVFAIDEVHCLCVSFYGVACDCCEVHNSIAGRRTCSVYALSERVVVIQALEDVVKRLHHAGTSTDRTKHVHMFENADAILGIQGTLRDDTALDRLSLGVHDANFSCRRACECLRCDASSFDCSIVYTFYHRSSISDGRRKCFIEYKHRVSVILTFDIRDNILDRVEYKNIASCNICNHSSVAGIPITRAKHNRDFNIGHRLRALATDSRAAHAHDFVQDISTANGFNSSEFSTSERGAVEQLDMRILNQQLNTGWIYLATCGVARIWYVGVASTELTNEQLLAILGISLHRVLRTDYAHRKRSVSSCTCTGELLVHCHTRKIKIGYCHFLFPYLYVLGSYSYAFKHRPLRIHYPAQIATCYYMYRGTINLLTLHLCLYKIRSVYFKHL